MWGSTIRRKREELGLTQEAFAEAVVESSAGELSLDRTSVAKWEAGTFAPALRYRPHIAKVLGTEVPMLFQRLPLAPVAS